MHPNFYGDSYDLVKRFFSLELSSLGYEVVVDPRFTGEWNGHEESFFRLLGAKRIELSAKPTSPSALILDPDTGVNEKGSDKHVSFLEISKLSELFQLIVCFDQSFSRQSKSSDVMASKMSTLSRLGLHTMYYDSHARFLFVSKEKQCIVNLYTHLVNTGLPQHRLISWRA